MANGLVTQVTGNTEITGIVEKLSFKTKVSYGLGQFSSSIVWSMASTYLLFFYTDIFGLTGSIAALILLLARVWDCLVDPILGLIMERTKSKHGRFRPYILYGAVAITVLNILTFYTPSFSGMGKIVYAGVTYLLLGTVYSIVTVPYGALATVMVRDTQERTNLNSYSGFFGQVAGIVTGAAVMPLITVLGHGNQQHGFFYASIILSVVSMPLFFITFKNCKEVITPAKEERPTLMDSLKAVGTNKPLMLIMITLLVVLMGLWERLGTLTYYAIYVLHRPDLIAVFFTALSVTGAVGAMFLPYISKYFEKRTIMIVGTVLSGLAFIAIYFIPATSITTVIVLSIVSGIPFSFASPLTFSMIADCIDEHQVKTGVRADGAIYAFTSFSTKLASALVGALSGVALSAIGYVANKPQTEEAMNGINMIVNLIPGILFIVAMIPLFFYHISKARATQNTEELLRRRNNFLS